MLRKKIKLLICISFIKASRKAEDFNKTKVKKLYTKYKPKYPQ